MKIRESNYELMRIVSMIFIIIYHTIGYGNLIYNADSTTMKLLLYLTRFIVIVHVNSFVLVSGYFQSKSKFKLSKLLLLILQSLFYVNLLNLVLYKLGYIEDISKFNLLTGIIPSSIGQYWFIATYIVLYILSDYINKIIDRLSRLEYRNLLILLFIVMSIIPWVTNYEILANSGFSIDNFVFLYLIGGYLRRYPLKETYHFKNFTTTGYFFLLLFIFFSMAFVSFFFLIISMNTTSFESIDWLLARINNVRLGHSTPYVIIQSICYFEMFGLLRIRSKIINYLSSCTFGIYLFHEHKYIRPLLYVWLGVNKGYYIGGYYVFKDILVATIIIFLIGVVIESARKIIFKFLSKTHVFRYLSDCLKKIVTNLSFNINW